MDTHRDHTGFLPLGGLGLGLLAVLFMWRGHVQLDEFQRLTGSTFEFSYGDFALFHLWFLLAGAAIGGLLLLVVRPGSITGVRPLIAGAIPAMLLMLLMWDWFGPAIVPSSIFRRFHWILDVEVQAASAALVGTLLTVAAGAIVGSNSDRVGTGRPVDEVAAP